MYITLCYVVHRAMNDECWQSSQVYGEQLNQNVIWLDIYEITTELLPSQNVSTDIPKCLLVTFSSVV